MATFAVGLADTVRVKRESFSSSFLLSFFSSFSENNRFIVGIQRKRGIARGASIGLTGLG